MSEKKMEIDERILFLLCYLKKYLNFEAWGPIKYDTRVASQ